MDTRGNAWSVRQSIKSNTELSADAHLKRQADLFMRIEITFILSTVMLILLLFSYIVR
jgi:lipopolysaccharide/colanic/teichoic acid biosynthesis glycosyltransferase